MGRKFFWSFSSTCRRPCNFVLQIFVFFDKRDADKKIFYLNRQRAKVT